MNLYNYVGNNPLNATDPTGMLMGGLYAIKIREIATKVRNDPVGSALIVAGASIVVFDIVTFPSGEGAFGVAMITAARTASTATKVTTGVGGAAGLGVESFNQYQGGEFNGFRLAGSTLSGAAAGYGSTRGTTIAGQMSGAFRGGFYSNLGTETIAQTNNALSGSGEFNLGSVFSTGIRGGTFSALGAGGVTSNMLTGTSMFGVSGALNNIGVGAGAGVGEAIGAGASESTNYLQDLWKEANQ